MKSFNQITDVGRGRLLFTSRRLEAEERLYQATTGEFILCKNERERILSDQEEAIKWAVRKCLCHGKRDFIAKCVEEARVPFKTIVPEVRLIFGEDAQEKPSTPEVRAQELIQHPIYNRCLIKFKGGLESHQLDEDQRAEVLDMVNQIRNYDYYGATPVVVSPEITIYDQPTDTHAHGFRVEHDSKSFNLTCFTVLAAFDLPYDIRDYIRDMVIDECTWLIIPDFYDIWNRETRLKFTLIAIALCIHFQLNYEHVYSLGENPLDIFQGIDISQDMDPVL